MKKKYLLLILTIILAIPVIVFAGPNMPENAADLDIDAPVIGGHPDYLGENSYVTVLEQTWTNVTDDTEMTRNDVFQAKKQYHYSLRYKPLTSQQIWTSKFEDSPYSLGGGGSSGPSEGGWGWTFYTGSKDDLVIHTGDVVIKNTIVPKANETTKELDITADNINAHGSWIRKEGESEYYGDESFLEGAVYIYRLYLSATPGYSFDNDFQVVNNAAPEKIITSSLSGSYESGYLTYDVQYQIERPVQSITLKRENNNSIFVGSTAKINATINPTEAANEPLTWSSLNTDIATVSQAGIITARSVGTATIKVESENGVSATIDIVVSPKAEQISFNNTELILKVGEAFTLTNILKINTVPSNAGIDPVTWASSDSSIASVDGTMIYANSPGKVTITATEVNGKQTFCEVTVRSGAETIRIEPSYIEIYIGETVNLEAIVYPESVVTNRVTWSTNNDSVSVTNEGEVTGLREGRATITAETTDGKVATATVVVNKQPVVESLSFDQSEITINVGESQQLNLTIYPDDAVDKTITWSSSNSNVVRVSNRGVVTGINSGRVEVTARSSNGIGAKIVVKVVKNGFLKEMWNGKEETFFYINNIKQKGFITYQGKIYYLDERDGKLLYGWQSKDNNRWYQQDDGSLLIGLNTIDGKLYYFNSMGFLQTGFITINGRYYYFSEEDGYAVTGWINTEEGTYYQQDDGTLLTGYQTIEGKHYYFNNRGLLTTGFIELNGKKYFFSRTYGYALQGWVSNSEGKWYQNEDGSLLIGVNKIGDKYYYFDNNGMLQTGFITYAGKKYFFSRTYEYALQGWVSNFEGKWYQQADGSLLTGYQTIGGKHYYFDEEGMLRTGFITINNKIYFFSRTYEYALEGWVSNSEGKWYQQADGSLLTGIQIIDGEKYYFGADGKLITGFVKLDGKNYFFSRTYGHTLYGWVSNSEGKWYQQADGSLLTGYQTIDGKHYYFNEDGMLTTGFIKIDGKNYFFSRTYDYALEGWVSNSEGKWYQNEDGSLLTGYQTIGGKHYYFNEDGMLTTGFVTIDGKVYFFSRTYDYALEGWVSNSEGKWYQLEDGSLITGLQTIDGKHYYFGEDGKIATGFFKIDGKIYFFSRVSLYALKGWVVSDTEGVWYQDEDGSLITGYHTIDGRDYYFNEETGKLDGFRVVDGKTYYFNPDGTKAKGVQYIANTFFQFNSITGEYEKRVRQIRVIDISSHNGDINWTTVKNSGMVDAVILRLGYGQGYLDTKFIYNKNELERLGIPYSVYLFSYAENGYEALQESNFLVDTIRNNNVHIATNIFGIYYDLESWDIASTGESSSTISLDAYGSIISSFIDNTEQKLCIKTRVYASTSYITDRFPEVFQPYATWVADWRGYLGYTGPYEGWQYTSTGYIPGINTNVDLSYFYM